MEIYELTAREIVRYIKDDKLSIKDVVDSLVKRIEKLDSNVRAWAFFDKESVYSQIAEADRQFRDGFFDSSLLGVPVGVKDIFNTIDMPTEMGSPIWKGFTPGNDARVVHNIRMESGIIMGKTVTAEFAVHYPGPTSNPYNFDFYPGTSSSGSAAAVACGMVPVAIGTQTAGSIIRPSSYCGVYGYKPSFGLLPRTGILKTVDLLDHIGFLSRSVNDMELMLNSTRVRGDNYPYVCKHLEDTRRQDRDKKQPWRVAFVKTYTWNDAEQYVRDSVLEFVNKVSKMNDVQVSIDELPQEFDTAHETHKTIYHKALSYYFKNEYTKHKEKLSPIFKNIVEEGQSISLDQYKASANEQESLSLALDSFFDKYDIIISTSTASAAKPKGLYLEEKRDASLIWTLCRVPSMNVPVFNSPTGMPFGVQIISRRYNDYLLLSFIKYLKDNCIIYDSRVVL